MIQAVFPAPISIHLLGVAQPVSAAAADIRHKNGEAIQGQELDQGHREPGKIRPFLALRAAMHVVNQWAGAGIPQGRRRQVKPG